MLSAPPPSEIQRSRFVFFAALFVWTAAIAFGFRALVNYEVTPGSNQPLLASRPEDLGLARDQGQSHLVMLAHPQCPCSRASVAELEKIMTACRSSLLATVLFYAPSTESQAWARSDLWRRAEAIPGVSVQADPDGRLAERMSITTSGHALLFDANRTLLFSGGITGARGHEGDNAGQSAVVALVLGEKNKTRSTAVFGCAIQALDKEPGAVR